MKKALLISSLLLLVGCGRDEILPEKRAVDNESIDTSIKLDLGTYQDVNNIYNGSSLHEITLEDNGVASTKSCAVDAGCTNYKGTYSIVDNNLYVHLTEFQDVAGEWGGIPRDSDVPYEYEITDNNQFEMGNQKYKLK